MSKFIELLKASIRRELQWEDTRTDADELAFRVDDEASRRAYQGLEPKGFQATVPMQLGRH
ncbi:MAG: hypothetical protein ACO1PB_18380 [Ramlibacter sp.]